MNKQTEPTVAPFGTFHDVSTGEYIVRNLTAEEIAAIPVPIAKSE